MFFGSNSVDEPGIKIRPLDVETGSEFLVNGWKYSLPGTMEYTKEVIEKGMSAGVYVEGKPVSGIIQNPNGLIGMLYTARTHRSRGYAKLCQKKLMKELGENGFVVASCVECKNAVSNKAHESIGMTLSHTCDYIFFSNVGFEAK